LGAKRAKSAGAYTRLAGVEAAGAGAAAAARECTRSAAPPHNSAIVMERGTGIVSSL
jgi:hypothetical protein